ncbi:hypothetical protein [Thermocoleostomius sinensis]|uniref:Uncharacterized protein n=1 Tax=Thermocoleostomius sinensis A174 TaxID=2016057 RepID=A0A9E8Z8W4_9CYAN|nr:hypothetical protein [Thermocoleostomius sinensis]WAL58462.1 hypothetical protein OXH18_14850 [Thermocoleostomius sinensis A174]
MKLVYAIASKPRFCFVVLLAALYGGLLVYLEGLQFPLTWDEPHFWEVSLQFSHRLLPTIDQLQNYGALNTPLPFVIFGMLEYLFQGGVVVGRLLNVGLSLTIVWLIGTSHPIQKTTSLLAAIGLLIFPYYLLLSGYLYTDIMAAFFVFFGCWFYQRQQHGWSAVMFALAIATRQYMLAFPVAIATHEFLLTVKQTGLRPKFRWVAPLLASATIGGWILLFNGLTPASAISNTAIPVPTVQKQLWLVDLSASLYSLACLGIYFVIPEWILFDRQWKPHRFLREKNYVLAFVLLLLLIIFPPFQAHGLLIKVVNIMPAFILKLPMLYIPGLLAVIRFSRFNLGFWLVLINAGLMIKAYPWDKYLLPLLVVLWYFRSVNPAHLGAENSTNAPAEAE